MQTAMQELIEWLDIAIEELKGNDSTDFAEGLVAARVKANKALEKEKEQIIDAINTWCSDDNILTPEQYYNETYNQNK